MRTELAKINGDFWRILWSVLIIRVANVSIYARPRKCQGAQVLFQKMGIKRVLGLKIEFWTVRYFFSTAWRLKIQRDCISPLFLWFWGDQLDPILWSHFKGLQYYAHYHYYPANVRSFHEKRKMFRVCEFGKAGHLSKWYCRNLFRFWG